MTQVKITAIVLMFSLDSVRLWSLTKLQRCEGEDSTKRYRLYELIMQCTCNCKVEHHLMTSLFMPLPHNYDLCAFDPSHDKFCFLPVKYTVSAKPC